MSEELGSTPRPDVHPSHEMYWFGPSAHPGAAEAVRSPRDGHGGSDFTKDFTWEETQRNLASIPLGRTPLGEPEFIIYEG